MSASDNTQPPQRTSSRLHLSTTSVIVNEAHQQQHLEAWLSLGSYEDVLNSDFHFWEVKKQLKDNGMEMTRILRLHTPQLREIFDSEIENFKKSRPGCDINIADLYHGTMSPLDQICDEGLDQRLSSNPNLHFGRGIYFSDNPEMCRAFCEDPKLSTDEHFVVRCQVILGDAKVYGDGQYDPSLTREPLKSEAGSKKVHYDSIKGRVGPYTQFVVYEKRRVYIQYVVYYTSTRTIPSLPPVPRVVKRPSASSTDKQQRQRASSGQTTSRDHAVSARRPTDDTWRSSEDESGSDTEQDSDNTNKAEECLHSSASSSADEDAAACANSQIVVPVVSSIRNRTRRLLQSSDAGASDAAASGSSNKSVSVATVLAAAAGSASTRYPAPLNSLSAARYRHELEVSAIQQLMDLKGKIPDHKFQELLVSYDATYGPHTYTQSFSKTKTMPSGVTHLAASRTAGTPATGTPATGTPAAAAAVASAAKVSPSTDLLGGSAAGGGGRGDIDSDVTTAASSNDFVVDDDEDVIQQQIMNSLIDEFVQCAVGADRQTAQRYIASSLMDVQAALGTYFDDS